MSLGSISICFCLLDSILIWFDWLKPSHDMTACNGFLFIFNALVVNLTWNLISFHCLTAIFMHDIYMPINKVAEESVQMIIVAKSRQLSCKSFVCVTTHSIRRPFH